MNMCPVIRIVAVVFIFLLHGCGGFETDGESLQAVTTPTPEISAPSDPDAQPSPGASSEVSRLPLPGTPVPSDTSAFSGLEPHYPGDERKFSLTGLSPVHYFNGVIHVGGEVQPKGKLRDIGVLNGVAASFDSLRDGAGRERVENYLDGVEAVLPFRPGVHPRIIFEEDWDSSVIPAVFQGTMILNAALPPESWISIDAVTTIPTFSRAGWEEDEWASLPDPLEGDVFMYAVSESDIDAICGESALACANGWRGSLDPRAKNTWAAVVFLPDTLEYDEYSVKIFVHEMTHALALKGHVDSIQFPDSLMGTSGDYFAVPGHIIHRIDREALQAVYLSEYFTYNDLSTWDDTTFHIRGDIPGVPGGEMAFGVALQNGLPQPWAFGPAPEAELLATLGLSGMASWTGALMGFSPMGESHVVIVGGAGLVVNLGSLASSDSSLHDLRFTNLKTWGTAIEQSWIGRNGEHGQLSYKVTVGSYGFNNFEAPAFASDEGIVTGAFFGERHEAMGGTLQRSDLIAAFGGKQ